MSCQPRPSAAPTSGGRSAAVPVLSWAASCLARCAVTLIGNHARVALRTKAETRP